MGGGPCPCLDCEHPMICFDYHIIDYASTYPGLFYAGMSVLCQNIIFQHYPSPILYPYWGDCLSRVTPYSCLM